MCEFEHSFHWILSWMKSCDFLFEKLIKPLEDNGIIESRVCESACKFSLMEIIELIEVPEILKRERLN